MSRSALPGGRPQAGSILGANVMRLIEELESGLRAMTPERTSMRSYSGHEPRNSRYSSSLQKPMTRSTPARLYQLRSKRTISPAAGRWGT